MFPQPPEMQEEHLGRWHSLCLLTWRLTGNGLSWFPLWGQRGLHCTAHILCTSASSGAQERLPLPAKEVKVLCRGTDVLDDEILNSELMLKWNETLGTFGKD